MTTNDKLLQQFVQAAIDKLDIEDLLSDSFIIVDELYKLYIDKSFSNRPGSKSKFSDSEVLAIGWVGEIFSIESENAWYNFVVKHFAYLFHHIPKRSRFNKRRRNLWVAIKDLAFAWSKQLAQVVNKIKKIFDIFLIYSYYIYISYIVFCVIHVY
jgi:hypothetical protein